MSQLNDRLPVLLAFFCLAALLVVRGVVPAMDRIRTDFPNYYTAGKIVASGGDVGRLYDDAWFQSQIQHQGIGERGKFSPFPPATALLFVPVSFLSPLSALRLMTVLNLALLCASVLLLSRILSTTGWRAGLLVLLSGVGLWNCLIFGQLYIALSTCVVLGYFLYLRQRPILSGIAFGMLIPVKYYPVVFLLYFALVREWKIILAALATVVVIVALSIWCLGWEIHREFFVQVLGDHLASRFSGQTPYATAFQSWDSLFRRMFDYNPAENPHPLLASPLLYRVLKLTIISGLMAAALPVLLKIHRASDLLFRECAFALLGILPLLVAPGTATYHFVLFWLPGGLLLHALWTAGLRKLFYSGLAFYSVLGFIPYGLLSRLAEKWSFWPLAYPRLFAVLALFLVCSIGAWTMNQSRAEMQKEAVAPS